MNNFTSIDEDDQWPPAPPICFPICLFYKEIMPKLRHRPSPAPTSPRTGAQIQVNPPPNPRFSGTLCAYNIPPPLPTMYRTSPLIFRSAGASARPRAPSAGFLRPDLAGMCAHTPAFAPPFALHSNPKPPPLFQQFPLDSPPPVACFSPPIVCAPNCPRSSPPL